MSEVQNRDYYSTVLKDEAETVALGELLTKASNGSGIIFLHGDLGMGKTTLCRGVLHGLGHKGHVKSPTYTLVEPYELAENTVYHFDLYRLAEPEELEFMGIRDYLDQQALSIIEWPEKGMGILPDADLELNFQMSGVGRRVRWHGNTEYGKSVAAKLMDLCSLER